MNHAKVKAMELVIAALTGAQAWETTDPEKLIAFADMFLAYIDPEELLAADGNDYPRIQVPS